MLLNIFDGARRIFFEGEVQGLVLEMIEED
jgi:hypothetical protein